MFKNNKNNNEEHISTLIDMSDKLLKSENIDESRGCLNQALSMDSNNV